MTMVPAVTTFFGIIGSVISFMTMGASVPAMLITAGSIAASLAAVTASVVLLLKNFNKLMLTLGDDFYVKNTEIVNQLQGDFSSLELHQLHQLHQLLVDIDDASDKVSEHLRSRLSRANYLSRQCAERQRQLDGTIGSYKEEINGLRAGIMTMSGASAQANLPTI